MTKYLDLYDIKIIKTKDLNESQTWKAIRKASGAWVLKNRTTGQEHTQYFASKSEARKHQRKLNKTKKRKIYKGKAHRRISEEVAANAMGDGSGIATVDPLLLKGMQKRRIKKSRKDK